MRIILYCITTPLARRALHISTCVILHYLDAFLSYLTTDIVRILSLLFLSLIIS